MIYVPQTLGDLKADTRKTLGDGAKLSWTDEALEQAIRWALNEAATKLRTPQKHLVGVIPMGENAITDDFGLGVVHVALEV